MRETLKLETTEHIIAALKHGAVSVTFTKKDGTKREMLCTLSEEFMTPDQYKVSTAHPNDSCIPVFDIENDGWRSFKPTSVIEAHIV